MNHPSPVRLLVLKKTLLNVTTTLVLCESRHVALVLSPGVRMAGTWSLPSAMESVTMNFPTELTRTVYLVQITVSAYSELQFVM